MPKLKLEAKKERYMIKRREKNSSNYVPANDPAMFPLLTDNRSEDEIFSRVDKYWVNHYYYAGTEQLRETIFYPSSYGIEEIEKIKDHPCKKLYKRLVDEGIGLKGERPVPNIEKPVKRLELECKPKRMRLECNE